MPGPSPKPTALKVLQGNAGKRAIPKNEPKPKAEKPRTPAHLSPKAKYAFKGLSELLLEMGVLTIADSKSLELLCDAYSEWRDLRDLVNKHGFTYETTNQAGETMIKARPEVAMASDAFKRIRGMINEFGLSPASRTKVQTNEPQEHDQLAEFLNRRRK
ncbi:MAG: phage terminase small subunit P27 family [Motiliproteus sp.]|nr:phage terminase small subunit P27 family [Motiliproteus sp.]MCW9051240.1 phage terminase small subunit P27 family [Motiliproteus sp.]